MKIFQVILLNEKQVKNSKYIIILFMQLKKSNRSYRCISVNESIEKGIQKDAYLSPEEWSKICWVGESKVERRGCEKENDIFFQSVIYSCITCIKKQCFNHKQILDKVSVYKNTFYLYAVSLCQNHILRKSSLVCLKLYAIVGQVSERRREINPFIPVVCCYLFSMTFLWFPSFYDHRLFSQLI